MIFASTLAPLRSALERGRLVLREQLEKDPEDADAQKLLHATNNVVAGLALLERSADGVRWKEHADALAQRARDIHAQIREYADRRRLHYVPLNTPLPTRHDTRELRQSEIEALVAAMPRESTAPPPPVAEAIAEAQLANEAVPIPPDEPTGVLPIAEDDDGDA